MDLEHLKAKQKVISDLLGSGVIWARVTDTEIEVGMPESKEVSSGEGSAVLQTVNVNVSASAQALSLISEQIQEIAKELEKSCADSRKVLEAKAQLKILEKELKKKNPQWDVIKKVMSYALDFSKELFLRLAVIVAQHILVQQ